MRAAVVILVTLTLCVVACGGESRSFGEPCSGDHHCRSKLCVTPSATAEEGMCTRSCATDDGCPSRHSCSGVTNKGVVVCLPGPSVPIGG